MKHVLDYFRLGWSIIPIPPGKKQARIRWKKYQTARPDEKQLRQWFGNGKLQNMAVVLGEVSGGLTCRDFDTMAEYKQWAKKYPDLAKTLPTVKTARGRHVYFLSDFKGLRKVIDGELRGSGVYCLLPPSVHPDGPVYEWLIPPNGNILTLDPFQYGMAEVTEETEDIEDIEDIERYGSNSCVVYVFNDLEKDIQKIIEKAIEKTLPPHNGYRNKCIFQYCRWLKGIPLFSDCRAKQLKPIVRNWHEYALPRIKTIPFDETWADFAYGWPRVKWPKGDDRLKKAIELAMQADTVLPEAKQYESDEPKLLVRICYELQKLTQPEPFWLSCRDAGDILGVSHKKANKMLKMLMADDIIALVQKHTENRATRYKYIG